MHTQQNTLGNAVDRVESELDRVKVGWGDGVDGVGSLDL